MSRKSNPRLSESEALTIAPEAATGTPFERLMYMTMVQEEGGRLQWIVGSTTIGSGFEVVIDDATGAVLSSRAVGVR